jgi:arsenate reductase
MNKKKVLVLCTGNSCRSQIAEAYLRLYSNNSIIYSAGLSPKGLHPLAKYVLEQDGISTKEHTSNSLEYYEDINFDISLTVCNNAKEQCVNFNNSLLKTHHSFEDPANYEGSENEILEFFQKIRDEIKEFSKTYSIKHNL